ncbi:hypothetical protein ACH5RR_025430 [Cinchona calisaya]|uniref:NADH dehydrogenase subunit 6 n=1 Tax=Cinchona calisaya TaxID=153742 RepID=A0ABD2YZL2_9GENT
MWGRLFSLVVSLFLTLIKQPLLLWKHRSSSELPTTTTSGELELGPAAADAHAQEPRPIIIEQPPHRQAPKLMMPEWTLLVIGVCFTAVSTALQAYQTTKPLPPIFHWFCIALELSFVFLVVSIYIKRAYELASLVMEQAAIFLGATAFMMAIGMNLPPPFMPLSIAVYCIAILIVIFANLSLPS